MLHFPSFVSASMLRIFFKSVCVTAIIFNHSVETVIKYAGAFCNVRLLIFIPCVFFFTSCLTFLWIYCHLPCRSSVISCLKKLIETHKFPFVHRHKIYYPSNVLEYKVINTLLRVLSRHHFALKKLQSGLIKSRLLFCKKICLHISVLYLSVEVHISDTRLPTLQTVMTHRLTNSVKVI